MLARRRHTHSRTGCITCRLRRVKCDEGRPHCRRCTTDRRVCAGYAPPQARKKPVRRSKYEVQTLRIPDPSPVISPPRSPDEAKYFDYFIGRVSASAHGYFEANIWRNVLPLISQHEQATHQALIAMSCLHEAQQHRELRHRARISELSSLALRHYNKAIRLLTTKTGKRQGDTSSTLAILATCLVFIWIEYLLGQATRALTHIQSAFGIISQLRGKTKSTSDRIYDEICRFYIRLHTQGLLYGSPSVDVDLHLSTQTPVLSPHIHGFQSVEDAQFQLDTVVQSIFRFHKQITFPKIKRPASLSITAAISSYLSQLRTWHKHFQGLLKADLDPPQLPTSPLHRAALCEMEIQYLLTYITLANLVAASPTMVYDQYTVQFERMLEVSEELLALRNNGTSSDGNQTPTQSQTSPPPFTPPLIAPLFYTLIKCRHPRLRRRAIELGEQCPRYEGVWDRDALLQFAKWKVGVEEGFRRDNMGEGSLTEDNSEDNYFLPEHARIFALVPYVRHRSSHAEPGIDGAVVVVRYKRRVLTPPTTVVDAQTPSHIDIQEEAVTDLSVATVYMAELL